MPLKVGYKFGRQFHGFVNVGVMPSFLDQSSIKSETFDANDVQTDSDEFSFTSYTSNFDIAGIAEIGLGYEFKNRFRLFSLISYQRSFSSIVADQGNQIQSTSHRGVGVMMGIQYALLR